MKTQFRSHNARDLPYYRRYCQCYLPSCSTHIIWLFPTCPRILSTWPSPPLLRSAARHYNFPLTSRSAIASADWFPDGTNPKGIVRTEKGGAIGYDGYRRMLTNGTRVLSLSLLSPLVHCYIHVHTYASLIHIHIRLYSPCHISQHRLRFCQERIKSFECPDFIL